MVSFLNSKKRRPKFKFIPLFIYRGAVAIFIGLSLFFVFSHVFLEAHPAPLLANYILGTLPTSQEDIKTLAKFDLLILSPEQGIVRRSVIDEIRLQNPDIILLAYVPSESWNEAWMRYPANTLYRDFRMQDDWWLHASNGQIISGWPGLKNTNLSQGWSDYMIDFIRQNILTQGIWDGIFWDIVNDGISHLNDGDIDFNRDGIKDAANFINTEWQKRMTYLLQTSRERLPVKYLLINGSSLSVYQSNINGRMYENFPTPWEAGGNWSGIMTGLKINQTVNSPPQLYVFNANTNNTGKKTDYKKMRFGLVSSLLVDNVYFSFDYGDQNHNQIWWYDEYNVDLGKALGPAHTIDGNTQFTNNIWRRDFTEGIALINPTSQIAAVDLGGEFERLIGQQDPAINSGLISDKITLAARDGILLRKTFQDLKDVVYLNGSFLRFYEKDGSRTRNGFFAFNDHFIGGAKIFTGDLNGDMAAEQIVVIDKKMEIFNAMAARWYNDWPLGNGIKSLNFAIGILQPHQGKKLIMTGDKNGAVLISAYYGAPESDFFYPLGKKYKAGFWPSVGDVDGDGVGNIILATGNGAAGEILVLDAEQNIKKRFYPFGAKFTSGFAMTTGVFDGGGRAQIAVAAIINNKIIVKIFNDVGKKISEFTTDVSFGSKLIYLNAADVDNDGYSELIVGNH